MCEDVFEKRFHTKVEIIVGVRFISKEFVEEIDVFFLGEYGIFLDVLRDDGYVFFELEESFNVSRIDGNRYVMNDRNSGGEIGIFESIDDFISKF